MKTEQRSPERTTFRPAAAPPDFEQILGRIPVAVYATDADGVITWFNPAAAKLWGREPAVGVDKWCGSWRLYTRDGAALPHDQCPMAEALRGRRPVHGREAIAERPDGSRLPFAPYPEPLFDEDGALVGAVNTLIDLTERDTTEKAERRLAAIVASSDDAIVSKSLDGTIATWNAGAERLFGYKAEEIIGRSILTLIPPERHAEEAEIVGKIKRGERVEHYQTVRRRKDGSAVEVSLTVSPIVRSDGVIIGASKIARDMTEQRRTQAMLERQAERLQTLNRVSHIISKDLDLDRIVQSVTDIATMLSGAQFGAFFYNVRDAKGEWYTLYTLSGAQSDAFGAIGMPRNTAIFKPTFDGTEIVRSDDIRKDPRYGANPPHNGMPKGHLPVVSYLAVPVVSASGDVIGGLFFGHREAGMFSEEAETLVAAVAGQAAVAIDNARLHREAQTEIAERRRAEAAKELLLHEIKHRVKNTLATVQAIADQSFRHAPSEETRAFTQRLHALSDAHDLLTQKGWEAVDLRAIMSRALAPFQAPGIDRFSVEGPPVSLVAAKALLVAMILHELGTNAGKYGALSVEQGRVAVSWEEKRVGDNTVVSLRWRESGGPVVAPPARRGFGTRMIERSVAGGGGKAGFDFQASGLVCTVELAV